MLRLNTSATLVLIMVIAFSAFSAFSAFATARSERPPYSAPPITSVEVKEVPYNNPRIQTLPDCNSLNNERSFLDLGLGEIMTIGNTIWSIVNAGRPVVTVNTPEASAFPRGITCWTDLDSWQPPVMHAYQVSYKNAFGGEAIKFGFALHYTFGGGKSGVGKYLANATIMPTILNVSWGYTFDAAVEAEHAINVGSAEQPIAGLELNVKWTIKTVMQQSVNTLSYFVQGDGILRNDSPSM